MRQASKRIPESAEKTVRDIRRATRRHHSAEEKPRIVLEGLRGEDSIAELCRKEGINQNLYYRWSKEFLEAGKKRLAGDTAREATSDEVKELKAEARQLKETLAEVLIETACSKKRSRGWGGRFMRYSASEKFEIIELVEQSSLSIRRTLAPIGISKRSKGSNPLPLVRSTSPDGVDARFDLVPPLVATAVVACKTGFGWHGGSMGRQKFNVIRRSPQA